MAITTFSQSLGEFFPAGTALKAYPASNWPAHKRPPAAGTAPLGTETASATMAASGVVSFTGLADSTEYYVTDSTGTKYVRITTYPERQEVMSNQADQPQGYPRLDANTRVPSSELTPTVINVRDTLYGATGDGTTNDRAAINSAIAAAEALITSSGRPVTVLFPPGLYYVNSGSCVYAITKSLSNRLILSGYGAQIKLGASCPRFLDFNKTADGDVFQNVTVEGFRIDANSVGGKHHVVMGCYQGGTGQSKLSFQDITVQDVHAFNIVTSQVDTTDRRVGLELYSQQAVTGDTATFIRRVRFRRVKLEGGNKGFNIVGVTSGTNASGYTQNLDDIVLVDCHHDTVTLLTSNPSGGSLNFQIGGVGNGGRVLLERCYGRGSGDVGVETDGLDDVRVNNTTIDECAGNAFYHTNFNTPVHPNDQTIEWHKCRARNYSTPGSSGGGGIGFRVSKQNSVSIGHVRVRDCKRVRDIASAAEVRGEGLLVEDALSLRVDGLDVAVGSVAGSNSGVGSLVRVNGIVPRVLLRGLWLYFASASVGSPATQMLGVEVEGSGSGANASRFTIDGVHGSLTATSWATGALVRVGAGGGTYRGVIRRVDPNLSGGWRCIDIPSSSTMSISQRIDIVDCDFTNIGGGNVEVNIGDATNRARVFMRDCVLQTAPTTAVASASTVTLPNIGEYFTISGTTGITSITSSWFGRRVTLVFSGALTMTDGSNLKLAGDFTTTADDSITLACDGTNWTEVARAVN